LCLRIENVVSKFYLSIDRKSQARVGISIGTATFGADGETLDQLLMIADNKMYRVKSAHRRERRIPVATSPEDKLGLENLVTVN
jgi:diguanylate cyclase (GGDEF)-like protein